ncbi:hypothetical protein BY458DRAFT_425913, partial [Sporodiniella umbellata]
YLLDVLLGSVNSLQLFGLGIYFLSATLQEPRFKMGQVQPSELTRNQEFIRGTWNPSRNKFRFFPPLPK